MRTSVEIALQDSASSEAKKIASGFDAVTQSADGINSALDPKMLEDYNRKLTQIGETYSQIKNKEKTYNQQQINMAQQVQGIASAAGRGVGQLGAGDIGGAAMTAGGGIKGLASLLGGPAAMIGGLALAGGMGAYKLGTQYEQRAVPAGRVAALSGQYGTDIRSNTMALRDAMSETTDAVSKYGKTFEEGARAQETFLMAGGRDFSGSRAAQYSMAYGLDFNRAAAFEGLTGRYGQKGGLDWANVVRREQGLSPAMLGEVMGGMQDLFTQGLSRGAVRDVGDISRQMEFFGRAGMTWQGAMGAQKLQGMGQVLAGAGGLQNQSDLFLYRAASKLSKGDILETKKRMEGGMTADMFKGLMGEFERFGYGRTESVLQLSRMFGLSTTEAERMYGLTGEEAISEFAKAGQLPGNMGKTTESEFRKDREDIIQFLLGGAGATAFDTLAAATSGVVSTGDFFSNLFKSGKADTIEANELRVERVVTGTDETTRGHFGDVLTRRIEQAKAKGVTESDITNIMGPDIAAATHKYGPGGTAITSEEQETLSSLLSRLIDAVNIQTEEIKKPMIMDDPYR